MITEDEVHAQELMAIRRWIGLVCPEPVKVHDLEMDDFTARKILLDVALRLDNKSIIRSIM
jgi:hypothetical protein